MQTKWIIKEHNQALASALSKELAIQPVTGRILSVRGFADAHAVKDFMNPLLSGMAPPHQMAGMERAVNRLLLAFKNKETVCIYGDYDVDGVTATALLVSSFTTMGINTFYHIPNRMDDGYGLNDAALTTVRQHGATLCVSVDCGVTAIAEASHCKEIGLDLIITDHHQPLDQLPDAVAVINPHRSDCSYPFKGLAGVGVAFNLLVALRAKLRESGFLEGNGPDLRQWLDLVALGTVADMVPLTGQNRILLSAGLQRMGEDSRTGVEALKKVSGVSGQVSSGQVGFRLAPRLNAAGRLESAVPGVELLLTDDAALASHLAAELDGANSERQGVERFILEDAVRMVEDAGGVSGRYSILLASEKWHPGVVGIVSSRLVERYHRPAILVAIDAEGNGKGSGRSIPGFHLLEALHECSDLLVRYGGHRVAAGVSIREEDFQAFAESFEKVAASRLSDEELLPSIAIDTVILPEEFSVSLVEELDKLAPFGMGNPQPLLCMQGLKVVEKRKIGTDHLRLRLKKEKHYINAVAWRMAGRHLPDIIDIAGTVEIDGWGGGERLQFSLKDFRESEKPDGP